MSTCVRQYSTLGTPAPLCMSSTHQAVLSKLRQLSGLSSGRTSACISCDVGRVCMVLPTFGVTNLKRNGEQLVLRNAKGCDQVKHVKMLDLNEGLSTAVLHKPCHCSSAITSKECDISTLATCFWKGNSWKRRLPLRGRKSVHRCLDARHNTTRLRLSS